MFTFFERYLDSVQMDVNEAYVNIMKNILWLREFKPFDKEGTTKKNFFTFVFRFGLVTFR